MKQPYSKDAERATIACCILDNDEAIASAADLGITPEDFYFEKHGKIFRSLLTAHKANGTVDEIILAEELNRAGDLDQIGGLVGINEIVDSVDTAGRARQFMKIVKDNAVLRELMRFSMGVIDRCENPTESTESILGSIETEIFNITSSGEANSSTASMSDVMESSTKMIDQYLNRRGEPVGTMSGFRDIDSMLGGMQPGQLLLLAARPSLGKTSLAMCIAENVAVDQNIPVIFFSLEMGKEELGMRMVCTRSRTNMMRIKDGFCTYEDKKRMARAIREIKEAPISIDDCASMTVGELKAKARRAAQRLRGQHNKNVGLIVVDYLQLIQGAEGSNRNLQVSEISRQLKILAKELGVPVLALSQLSRDSEKDKRRPKLSDLRDSGSLEQDADVVVMLSRPLESDDGFQVADNVTDVTIAKNRSGPVGLFKMGFQKTYTLYENYENKLDS